jgi:hypothetical protein
MGFAFLFQLSELRLNAKQQRELEYFEAEGLT